MASEPQPPATADATEHPLSSNLNPAQPPPDEDTTRRCFICLGDEPEAALPRDWATPCGCTLEGHQACLLDWISDLEGQGKEFRCPLCKARIQLVGRWSAAVSLSQHLHRVFSDWSPTVVLGFLGAGTVIGSAVYGLEALALVAGRDVVLAFLLKRRPSSPFPPELQRRVPFLSMDEGWSGLKPLYALNVGSFCMLPLIGPALVLNRLLLLPRSLAIPLSVLVCICRLRLSSLLWCLILKICSLI